MPKQFTARCRTAVRRERAQRNRAVLAAVDGHPGITTLVIDTTAQAMTPLSVVSEYAQIERDLADRGVTLWIAGLPPRSLALAKQLPGWERLEQAGHLHPTALAALRAYRS